jgi:hypothetical protein
MVKKSRRVLAVGPTAAVPGDVADTFLNLADDSSNGH